MPSTGDSISRSAGVLDGGGACRRQESAPVLGDVAGWGGFQDARVSCAVSTDFLDVDVTV